MKDQCPPGSTTESVSAALKKIAQGMTLTKCRKCGCMQGALEAAERAFANAVGLEFPSCLESVRDHLRNMEPIAYDCLGCEVCWGAEATVLIGDEFGNEIVACGRGTSCDPATTAETTSHDGSTGWPPEPGEYLVGNPSGPVAICTLASHEFPARLIAMHNDSIAIAGRCDTENIGIGKLVKNIVSNPAIRWLILCGIDSRGHRAGDALLKLKEHGVDSSLRIQNATSWRPVLTNLTLREIARFRAQIEIMDLIGNTDQKAVLAMAHDCGRRPAAPMAIIDPDSTSDHPERITAFPPTRLQLDPAGFFIVIPDRNKRVIVCEHYENSGRLAHIIEGKDAALIAATAVERGMLTRLDHAAYLGRELTRAESALRSGQPYEQDAALGNVSTTPSCSDSKCSCH